VIRKASREVRAGTAIWGLVTVLAFAVCGLLLPSGASALNEYRIVFHNETNSDVKLVGTDNQCWYKRGLDISNAIEVNPNQTGLIYTEDNGSGSCYSESSFQNLDVVFKGPGGKYPDPYKGAVSASNAFPYSAGEGGWDLLSKGKTIYMRNWPKGPLPINPQTSGTQSGGTNKGMFCLIATNDDQYKATTLHLDVRPGTRCYSWSARPTRKDKGVRRVKAGPSGKPDLQVVFDLFQVGKAACSLLAPAQPWGRTSCEDTASGDNWDLHNVSSDVKNAKPDQDAQVVGGWYPVATQTFYNRTSSPGEQSWKYEIKVNEESTSETESGWKVGGKIEWEKKFHVPIIGEFGQKLEVEVEHDWGSKTEQKHGKETSVGQEAKIEAEAKHWTTMIVKQRQASLLTTFTADLTAGTKGEAEPLATSATRSLGMSGARYQPCIGMIVGSSGNSLVGLNSAARARGWSPKSLDINEEQRGFLKAAEGMTIDNGDRCPGYPSGYPGQFSFNGTATYRARAGGPPTEPIQIAPDLPSEMAYCTYAGPIHDSPVPPEPDPPNAEKDDPCKTGAPGPLSEAGTIVDENNSGTGRTVEGHSGGSLIIAAGSKVGAPQAGVLRKYQGQGGEDVLRGSAHSENLLAGGGPDLLEGRAGDDEMNGQMGNDSLFGQGGNDSLTDFKGWNLLSGGKGNDRLTSSKTAVGGLLGNAGADVLTMKGRGTVVLRGGTGNDTYRLLGGARPRSIVEVPREGFDTVKTRGSAHLTPYIEKLVGTGQGGLKLTAGTGDQVIIGTRGNDWIAGGEGNDLLKGGAGNDRIVLQGNGIDLAKGGKGSDRFEVIANRTGSARFHAYLPLRSRSAHVIADLNVRKGDRILLGRKALGRKGARALKRRKIITVGRRPRGERPQLLFSQGVRLLSFDPDGTGPRGSDALVILRGVKSVPGRAVRIG